MAYSKPDPTGMQLFEDDGTPIRWMEIHTDAWQQGHRAGALVVHEAVETQCPFPTNSAIAICWEAGRAFCIQNGDRTPAGRKRKWPR